MAFRSPLIQGANRIGGLIAVAALGLGVNNSLFNGAENSFINVCTQHYNS